MRLNLVQYNPVWEDKKANKNSLIKLISEHYAEYPAENSVIILPELTLSGFTMKSKDFAEVLMGDSFKFFTGIAQNYKTHIIAGLIEKAEDQFYNTLIHINPSGELVNSYRKIHPFSYSNEHMYYSRGNKPVITEINGWKVGLSVCYDLRFPELYRYYGKERAELIIIIANWPDSRIAQWRTLLSARAIENQCYVAAVNRVGDYLNLHYNGYSSIFDPLGNELAALPDKEKIISADITKDNVEQVRAKFPFLDDIFLI
ncbi:MAG: carbon-nitrogen family hydrolase [Ignavibacteriaceae bacterium]|nr:carbon-nitrogen family hydrolase [Ignavibacteriaceae bacterium]